MSNDASGLVIDEVTARLILSGDEDEALANRLREQVTSHLHPPLQRLVIDVSECRFLEPAAVDVIGTAMGTAHERGLAMSVEGASANVRVILGIAGLLDFPGQQGSGAP